MICSGCQRRLEIGDRYIVDTPAAFIGREEDPVSTLLADLLGGADGKIMYCEDCTQDGGQWMFETVYGDEEGSDG